MAAPEPDQDPLVALQQLIMPGLAMLGFRLAAVMSLVDQPAEERIRAVLDELDELGERCRHQLGTALSRQVDHQPETLTTQITAIAAHLAEGHGLRSHVHVNGDLVGLAPSLTRPVLIVVTEALRNVVDHASADWFSIELTIDTGVGEELVLVVHDNGNGPAALTEATDSASDTSRPDRLGIGVAAMTASADALGGTCTVEPGNPRGTVVTWRVPLTQPSPTD